MALPTKNDLLTLDWGLDGTPFIHCVGTLAISTLGLEWGFEGTPFVVNQDGVDAIDPVGQDGFIGIIVVIG